MLHESYEVLDRLRKPHGLYIASPAEHYRYVWIRDSVYMSFPYRNKADKKYEETYYRMLDLFREYEWKLDILCREKPHLEWEYLHARYSAEDVKEIHESSWGHVQHDMTGAFLFGIGWGLEYGKKMLRDGKDKEIVQKLVYYLQNVEYWNDPDNGMWEEWREIHASSVGACVAGLKKVRRIVDVPYGLIERGVETLRGLFPGECAGKEEDLAQLSLIYPYRIYSGDEAKIILSNIESMLLRERGVIRYMGDSYFSTLEASLGRSLPKERYYGTEAEWTFGLPWLALCNLELGDVEKAAEYVRWTEEIMVKPGALPELYFSGTDIPNQNNPLGWSSAMYILAKEAVDEANLKQAGGF